MPWYLCSGGLGSSHTVTVRVQSYLTVAIFTCTVRPLDRLSSQGSPGLPKWYNDPSRLLNPPPPGRTCTRATPTPSAPAVDAQPVKSDIAALKPPPLSLYAHSRVCSPLVISSPCKTPLLDNRLSSSSHFKARTRAASPSFWETRGSQNQLSGEKKKEERKQKKKGRKKGRKLCAKANHEAAASQTTVASGQLAVSTCLGLHRSDGLLHPASCRLLQTYMRLSLYPRPTACRKSTAACVRAAVLVQVQLRARAKGPSLTARKLKRLWICSYEALRTQVTLLRKTPFACAVFGPM
ncbi:uncharacterized protein TRIVIDRAFT_197114 [Trichoderma virens Gv29-8]|uniref:Uncharacterized protein n=1 Tax=Hypocrea virens (strain Gv29-8 / FGSC 10586) TaxID=413071 RepID=G9MDU6_HYPVG|nr:uncharacterized protein TRIVIDRAFT_197114 [Trichoderma virens Gv29-8]EHK27255.1 hypothetical protein TRIVIDRAFT_197114 [Trichoderma virens Gv29-8]